MNMEYKCNNCGLTMVIKIIQKCPQCGSSDLEDASKICFRCGGLRDNSSRICSNCSEGQATIKADNKQKLSAGVI